MQEGRSSWAALDDGTPAGVLEKDADAVFAMLDEDDSGDVTRAEMMTKLLACDYTEDRVEMVFGKIANADGVITLESWRDAYIKYPTLRTAPGLGGALKEKLFADADTLFGAVDADGSGSISTEELQEHLQKFGYDDALVATMIKAVDVDKSGEIDQDELRTAFLRHPAMRTAKGMGASA